MAGFLFKKRDSNSNSPIRRVSQPKPLPSSYSHKPLPRIITSTQVNPQDMTLLRRDLPSPPPNQRSSLAYNQLYPSHVLIDDDRRYSVLDTNRQYAPSPQPSYLPSPSPHPIYEPQSRNHHQQHLYPEPSFALSKSPTLQTGNAAPPPSLPRGKPRIFAAMEAQPISPQPVLQNFQVQQQHQQQQQQLLAPTRNSLNEEFSTPRSQFDSLPEITANGDVDYYAFPTPAPVVLEPYNNNNNNNDSRARKLSVPRPTSRHDDGRKQVVVQPSSSSSSSASAPAPLRMKKLSKPRQHQPMTTTATATATTENTHESRTRMTGTTIAAAAELETPAQVDEETIRKAGIPLDDDPFARVEGVKMLKPTHPTPRHRASKDNNLLNTAFDDVPPRENGGVPRPAPDAHRPKKEKKEKIIVVVREPPTFSQLVLSAPILACVLDYLTFYEWCTLLALSKPIRASLVRTPALRETALERFLKTIGYARWPDATAPASSSPSSDTPEPLSLSLQDLSDYMRGVSTPTHEYARAARAYVHSLKLPTTHREPGVRQVVQALVGCTRAYNRVLLRLRAQVEREAGEAAVVGGRARFSTGVVRGGGGGGVVNGAASCSSSRPSSRAPSPAASFNHPPSSLGHGSGSASQSNLALRGTAQQQQQQQSASSSALFKLRRAPLLRVFVPSPEGDWLSDKSVLECEAECRRAGVVSLLRLGDVVWDVAVGDEGNVGRLVWDGTYLIDLDYTYSTIGELPKYLHALAFPPSYFHRVIRTGSSSSNPIVHIDVMPWGQEIVANLQLVQDRVRTETPQGAHHNLMRWVHRSSFVLRPSRNHHNHNHNHNHQNHNQNQGLGGNSRIPIPNTDPGLFVDPGWYGTIVVETEGTNEALADLEERCGVGASARGVRVRARSRVVVGVEEAVVESRRVWRILRERSRPGEIWVRAVSLKERLL